MIQLAHSLFGIALAAVSVSASSSPSAQGAVFRVGPTQSFTTIQSAVDSAASGDLILVDPGAYPEFHVNGKGVAIVADNVSFEVLESASSDPAIRIENLVAPDQVSIIGAHIDHGPNFNAPAVEIRNNTGAVRFSQLEIAYTADLLGTNAHAAIQIQSTSTFWLIDSEGWPETPHSAYTAGTGYREAVSGIEVEDSDGVIQNGRFRGYDAGLTWGGDALRIIGACSVWIVDDVVQSPTATVLRGGNGSLGGSSIQYLGQRSGLNRNTICGRVKMNVGLGTTQDGGMYSLNGDLGVVSSGQFPGLRLPNGCRNYEYAHTSVTSPTVGIGKTITFKLWSLVGGSYITAISDGTQYARNFRNVDGRSLIQFGQPQTRILFAGTLNPMVAETVQLVVPNTTSMIGTQATFQTITGPLGTQTDALTFPAMVVVTP